MKAIGRCGPVDTRRRRGRPTLSNEHLLDAAFNVFVRIGIERTSIEAIATAAGMAKRTVYARYGDKAALFKATLARAIGDWMVPVERMQSAECPDLEKMLLAIGRLLLTNILSPAGLQLLRLTNAVSVSMPEIAALNTRMGTESTLAYLADLFSRRLLPAGATEPEADEAALAFLHLIVGGPASIAAWGVVLDDESIDRHTRYCVRLFLHGALPATDSGAVEREIRRIKALKETSELLARAQEKLGEVC